MYIPVLIIGSGIAGLSVSYNLNKKNIENIIVTKEANYLKSNSIIAPANMRIFENIFEGVELYMNQCNGNYETINNIYSNQDFLIKTLNELNINVNKTPIGIIPKNNNELGGQIIIRKMGYYIRRILTGTLLIDIKKYPEHIECLLYNDKDKWIHINCGVIVFATGGFASIFKYNDNSKGATGECTYILQKETKKLKGMSTIMFHPFGVEKGRKILTGDIVSYTDNIYYKNLKGDMELLDLEPKILNAIKTNKYHNNEIFNNILLKFYNKDVYIRLKDGFDVNILKEHHINKNILVDNFIQIQPTAHYTSGGIVVDKNFKVEDRIFANGEIIFDGDKGIGRIPGHAFTSSIVGGRIISNEIQKIEFKKIEDETKFDIEKKILENDESEYLKIKEVYDILKEKVQNAIFINTENYELENEIKRQIEYFYKNIKSIKELIIYYRINVLYEIVKDLKERKI